MLIWCCILFSFQLSGDNLRTSGNVSGRVIRATYSYNDNVLSTKRIPLAPSPERLRKNNASQLLACLKHYELLKPKTAPHSSTYTLPTGTDTSSLSTVSSYDNWGLIMAVSWISTIHPVVLLPFSYTTTMFWNSVK